MKRKSRFRFIRTSSSRLSSLLLLFQRSPLVQMWFPEAKILGGVGLGEATKWTVAAITGLGAYDTVTGATGITQIIPTSGSTTVNTSLGSSLYFSYQITGSSPTITQVLNWTIAGTLPPGTTHPTPNTTTTDLITGFPAQTGSYPITITAKAPPAYPNTTISQNFTIVVHPSIITTHPASIVIAGGTQTLLTSGVGTGFTYQYQWFKNMLGSTASLTGATAANYNTSSSITETTSYYVSIRRSDGVYEYSKPAVVTIGTPAITSQPAALTTVASGTPATLTIAVTGASPTVQWYKGISGSTTEPISGATSLTYTTPNLTSPGYYWARVTSSPGITNSESARVVIGTPATGTFADWKSAQFNSTQLADTAVSGPTANPDGDAFDNTAEYVLGTVPLTREAAPLTLSTIASNVSLDFGAKLASGTGYSGRTRHYALETSTTLQTGSWSSPGGYSDITGNNQPVNLTTAKTTGPVFYRLRVWLTP